MSTQEELIIQKERVYSLSEKAKDSYDLLVRLCNEISFAENLDSSENISLIADNLMYILISRIVDHLEYVNSLISAYEDYSKTLEGLIP
jgi:hypothetical protein